MAETVPALLSMKTGVYDLFFTLRSSSVFTRGASSFNIQDAHRPLLAGVRTTTS